MFPALAAAGGSALKAGVSGIAGLNSAQEEEERQRRAALKGLSTSLQGKFGGDTFGFAPEIQKAPGVGEAVVAPMVSGAIGGLASDALSDEKEEDPFKSMARGYLGGK